MTAILEFTLSWIFKNAKRRDDKAFFTTAAFADHKEQTVEMTSPDCGPSGGNLKPEYSADGAGKIPTLEWKTPDVIASQVKEWLLFSEDPDAPLSVPICHGIYPGIAPEKTRVEPSDFEVEDQTQSRLRGGFYYGKNRRGNVYIPSRPILNHGPHRYFFEIVALGEPLDKELLKTRPDRDRISEAIKGKVLGWGVWIASYERKW